MGPGRPGSKKGSQDGPGGSQDWKKEVRIVVREARMAILARNVTILERIAKRERGRRSRRASALSRLALEGASEKYRQVPLPTVETPRGASPERR
jgi:hypothetical protein